MGVLPDQASSSGRRKVPLLSTVARLPEQATIGTGAVVVFLVAWQAGSTVGLLPKEFLPGPIDVGHALASYVTSSRFVGDLATTAEEFAIGYGVSLLLGIPAGLILGWYRHLRMMADPLINVFYSMPRFAFIPLVIIWFGVGISSKVAIVVLEAAFGMVITIMRGVMSIDSDTTTMAHSFNASAWQLIRTVALPGSVPYILTGLRLGTSYAIVGVVVAEFVEAQQGLGVSMLLAGNLGHVATVMAILLLFAALGLVLRFLLGTLERRFGAWRLASHG